jgi:antibiotic biosynthesis monooxygenase (ABM) superfamily enzyme
MEHKVILIVANEPIAEKDTEFKKWYLEEYVPLMVKFDGIKQATCYEQTPGNMDSTKYLAVYEFDNQESLSAFPSSLEFAAALKNQEDKWKEDIIDRQWWASYEVIKTWGK